MPSRNFRQAALSSAKNKFRELKRSDEHTICSNFKWHCQISAIMSGPSKTYGRREHLPISRYGAENQVEEGEHSFTGNGQSGLDMEPEDGKS